MVINEEAKKMLKKIETKNIKSFKHKEKLIKSKELRKKLYENKEWYTIRAILGNQWANWFILSGARERGKTFSVQDFVLNKYFNPHSMLHEKPFYWMRLNDIAVKNMLMNNGAKMFEPLLVRKYHLENIKVKGDTVFLNNKPLCYVFGLSTAYNNKGGALFDKKTFKSFTIFSIKILLYFI